MKIFDVLDIFIHFYMKKFDLVIELAKISFKLNFGIAYVSKISFCDRILVINKLFT